MGLRPPPVEPPSAEAPDTGADPPNSAIFFSAASNSALYSATPLITMPFFLASALRWKCVCVQKTPKWIETKYLLVKC